MTSALLAKLDAAIATAPRRIEADVLRAERIGLLARSGRLGEARLSIKPVQERHSRQQHVPVAAALMMAEALIDYFSEFGPQARAKLQQAKALSAQAKRLPLEALCSAWLAHLDYVHSDVAAMATHAAQALRMAAPDHHSARSRACLVVAMGYHQAGRFDLAQPWYGRARRHATDDGDVATTSAVIYTMAAIRISQLCRQAVQQGDGGVDAVTKEAAMQALLAAESSGHFDQRTGKHALTIVHPVMRAQVFTLQGRHAEAIELYRAHLQAAVASGLGRLECTLRADLAWCLLQLGQMDAARDEAQRAQAALGDDCDVDDIALTHGRLAQCHKLLGDADTAGYHAALAQSHWGRHEALQAQSVDCLQAALPGL